MSVPLRERIVEVRGDLGERADPRFRYGSGFVIGGRIVLTAAHVVVGAVAVVVRGSDKSERLAVLDSAYVGDPEHSDLALLELTELARELEFVPVAVVDRDTESGAFVEGCWSVGFPLFQEVSRDGTGRSVRKSAHVSGRIAPLSNLDDGLLSLRVAEPPQELPARERTLAESPWSGMSGAAVWAGEWLVGVVAEHARRRGASDITVAPLAFLSDPARAPANADQWWRRLGVEDPTSLPRVPAPTPSPQDDDLTRVRVGRVRVNVGHVDAYFTGRDSELEALQAGMIAQGRVVVTQAITGLGGVGKTQLAARYVREHADEYEVVAWIRAEDSPVADLAQLARPLRLARLDEDATDEVRARAVVHWLASCDESWLLVFDNVTSSLHVGPWIPATGNGRVLITSRNRQLDELGVVLPIDVFDTDTAATYLITRAGRNEPAAALALGEALGGLPLALAHAGAYCRAGTSFADYQAMLTGLPAHELFEHDPEAFSVETVATTWRISIDTAGKRAPLAAAILRTAAYLAPDAIPIALFETLLENPGDLADRKRLRDGLRALDRFSLAVLGDAGLDVHRLLQKVVRDEAEARDDDTAMITALDALEQLLPNDPAATTWWPQYEALLPHITAITETAAATRHPDRVVELLNEAAGYLLHAGGGQRAITTARSATVIAEQRLDEDDPRRLNARTSLAASYWSAGRTGDAIALQEPVLADSERLLGAEHPDTLTARGNLASSYRSAGRTGDAIALQEPVLADSERLLGAEHPDTLTARANLAGSYASAGRTGDAIALQEPVLANSERLLGAEHPDTLTARSNLALSYESAGRTGEAIKLQERVLGDCERLLGAEHRHTLSARANLALSYGSAGRADDAIKLRERVLADCERLLDAEHPDTLTARSNLAASYRAAGRIDDAIKLQERVLGDRERLLGAEHPDTLTARSNLAASYRSAGRIDDAIKLQERVLGDRERLLGAEHPDTLTARSNLARSYRSAGRIREAIELQERVLADFERLLGAEHPDTLTARSNLSGSYWSAGRIREAIELQERVLADRERLLGAEHPHTLTARANLALVYESAGRIDDAIRLQERVLADRERLLGAEHPDTLAARADLTLSYESAGRADDAIEW